MSTISQRTVVFLVKDSQVLLGFKKTGFGKGNYLGIGGKVEKAETHEQAAQREVEEEIQVTDVSLTKVGDFTFLFPDKPSWNQQVHAYLCNSWQSEPVETSEMKPVWFKSDTLPLTNMWDDAQFWLPAILNGHSLKGEFVFDENLKVIRTKLEEKILG